ncbi:hypothetical protein AMATHDRAFT_51016 [Amanita thiersii Skay4041]|uniref:Uncharacterized protein n=1 Tax=Amanita thiersii Skay4041 TaxID=703135 RepID=A0A2A9NFR2_9AGAR|nr:hypothetical protein AMATHDRAFT_51016 [Amanita thiersii Skay4041]
MSVTFTKFLNYDASLGSYRTTFWSGVCYEDVEMSDAESSDDCMDVDMEEDFGVPMDIDTQEGLSHFPIINAISSNGYGLSNRRHRCNSRMRASCMLAACRLRGVR